MLGSNEFTYRVTGVKKRPSVWERLAHDGDWDDPPPMPEEDFVGASTNGTITLPLTPPSGSTITVTSPNMYEIAIFTRIQGTAPNRSSSMSFGFDWAYLHRQDSEEYACCPWPRNAREKRIYHSFGEKGLARAIKVVEELHGKRGDTYFLEDWNELFWVYACRPKFERPQDRPRVPSQAPRQSPRAMLRRPQARG